MNTPDEDARDEWYSTLVDEISGQAIDEFTFERLRSYYVSNRTLAVSAISIFHEARKLLEVSPSSALVLFTTSIEVGLKVTLLKPVIYGLVHNESVADLISDLAVKHNGFDRFKPLLARVLKEYGSIDFNSPKIEGHSKTIWEEITQLQGARNAVVHRAELADSATAKLAQEVAFMIFDKFLRSILNGLSLELKQGGEICNA
ncbi:hypothetical protein JHS3_13530 [Jeongeupia sp. HS-3]|uniref:hypothetical protein n=1 Tax=Jeongeupia sp. HS-3 TaxID=1009682 RepID=UPI0018A501BA|nr:hypothetical protein [Jeongeupia sp. HS-3]BCL75617.1 hypothetical protein JHS3_13530 [Jeongeupia sp. HS-3]